MLRQTSRKSSRLFIVGIFIALLLVGFVIFDDYGISWDEYISRMNGVISVRYVFDRDPSLLTYRDRFYGTAFESLLALAERAFDLQASRDIFLMRHVLTFLMFFLGTVCFYQLARDYLKRRIWAVVTVFFLIISPRIFSDAFYNSKDLVFMAAWIVSMRTLQLFIKKPSYTRAILHAAASAYLTDIRMMGILVPLLTLVIGTIRALGTDNKKTDFLRVMCIYVGTCIALTVAFWPILWSNPIGNFIAALRSMSYFSPWQGMVLYFGRYVPAPDLPWHYIPVWIAITTPISYLILAFFGFGIVFYRCVRFPRTFLRVLSFDAVIVSWFVFPLAYVVLTRPILYDGWRHLYFIYPSLILFAGIGIQKLMDISIKKHLMMVIVGLVAIDMALVFGFMVRNHPYQNVYFNPFVGGMKRAKASFELDYWGLTFHEGLSYIARKHPNTLIKIYAPFSAGESIAYMLPEEDRLRMIISTDDPKGAMYFISNFRWHKEEFSFPVPPVYSHEVDGTYIMVVYDITYVRIIE